MKVLVCGSRSFEEGQVIWDVLDGMLKHHGRLTVVSGVARGADQIALTWAQKNGEERLEFPADWKSHGKSAGPIRNLQMLVEGEPDVVWAFVDKPLTESRGTAHMVKIAHEAGVPVRVVQVMG